MSRFGAVALAAILGIGCGGSDSIVVLEVLADPTVSPVAQIRVTVSNAGAVNTRYFPAADGGVGPIRFPATLAIALPRSRSGMLDMAFDGLDAAMNVVAHAAERVDIVVGGRADISVQLKAGPSPCGNAKPDPNEECDDGNRASGDGCSFRCLRESGAFDAGTGTDAFRTALDATADRPGSADLGSSGSDTMPAPGSPVLTISPGSAEFGAVEIGRTPSAGFTIRNTGMQASGIPAVTIGGVDYSQTNNCSAPLAPGAICTAAVTLRPTSTGAKTGTLIVTGTPGGVASAMLVGTGVATGGTGGMGGGAKQALFVVRDPALLGTGDLAMQKRLMDKGFTVTLSDGLAVTLADANAKALVVISDTVAPSTLAAKLVATTSPVLCMDWGLFDEMGMTAAGANGDSMNQTTISITMAGHPLAAGLTGSPIVSTAGNTMTWGTPAATAVRVAALIGNANQVSIFAYAANAMMVGRLAPAKRVGFYAQPATIANATADGNRLIDAAIDWTYLK